jgi:hypothetical protein
MFANAMILICDLCGDAEVIAALVNRESGQMTFPKGLPPGWRLSQVMFGRAYCGIHPDVVKDEEETKAKEQAPRIIVPGAS